MAKSADHALGQRLAQLIEQNGESAFEAGVLSRRLLAQLQDLLGSDTSMLNPLRDMLQRPAFRQLFGLGSQGQTLNARDALLRDLADVYSPAVLSRLDSVLQGCFNLPGSSWPTPAAAFTPASTSLSSPSSGYIYGSVPPSQMPPTPAAATAAPTVVTIPAGQQGPASIVIALLALICGALVMALVGLLVISRNPSSNSAQQAAPSAAPSTPAPPATQPTQPDAQPAPPPPQATPEPNNSGQWQACKDYDAGDSPPPQAGETWWPVVGPAESLQASRDYCRGDAFTNASGNTQIASFRDRDTAEVFAQQLTSDNSHPYNFWVGDPTQR